MGRVSRKKSVEKEKGERKREREKERRKKEWESGIGKRTGNGS
jgi:hypothetical protein